MQNDNQNNFIEIMDTTLRDGEQMQNVSYSSEEKLTISKILLTELLIDRLEITSARVSEGEKNTVLKISNWAQKANQLNKLEILGFVDNNLSVDWAKETNIHRINLLTKGSLKHCTKQLKKTPEEHFADIRQTIDYAYKNNIEINVYLEDFSSGIKNSPDYVHSLIKLLIDLSVKRIMLPDTLGILNPFETYDYLNLIIQTYPKNVHFDFHSHNDYALGAANALAAVKAGVKGIHSTINGMGERAGNAALDEIVVNLKDFLNVKLNINEKKLYKASQYVEMFSGQRMANNKPIYGKNVFTQTAGIHADGDKKGDLYSSEKLNPERFDRKKKYALGKLSGKASIDMSLKELGIELDNEKKQILLKKIIELGEKKEIISTEDLPFLISDIFETPENIPFKLLYCSLNTTYRLKAIVAIRCSYYDQIMDAYDYGDGSYDAFMNALMKILKNFKIPIPHLIDYQVNIPPGGKTDALVQANIYWRIDYMGKSHFLNTRGINPDQTLAAIEATVKLINIILTTINKNENSIISDI